MSFPNIIFGSPGDQFTTGTTQVATVGDQMCFEDGRKFRYGQQNASAAAVMGDVQAAAALVPNHILQTPSAAAAVGATTVTVTLGNTAATADQYKDGYLAIELGTGFGQLFQLGSHAAVAGNGVITCALREPVQTAIPTTANTVSLLANPYRLCVVAPTTNVSAYTGVAMKAVATSAFGWYQTRGPAAVTSATTVVTNGLLAAVNGTAGSASLWATTNPIVGLAMHTASNTNKASIFMSIDG